MVAFAEKVSVTFNNPSGCSDAAPYCYGNSWVYWASETPNYTGLFNYQP